MITHACCQLAVRMLALPAASRQMAPDVSLAPKINKTKSSSVPDLDSRPACMSVSFILLPGSITPTLVSSCLVLFSRFLSFTYVINPYDRFTPANISSTIYHDSSCEIRFPSSSLHLFRNLLTVLLTSSRFRFVHQADASPHPAISSPLPRFLRSRHRGVAALVSSTRGLQLSNFELRYAVLWYTTRMF